MSAIQCADNGAAKTRDRRHARRLLNVGSALCLISNAAAPALAQEGADKAAPSQAPASIDPQQETVAPSEEDIVVTASRIERGGFDAPTPTTVIGEQDFKLSASANIADVLNEIPSFKAAVTPAASTTAAGSAGQNILSLRGLGPSRTLVLVDGRRHVPSNSGGTFNVNVIPSGLIRRVEVVTGGASAAWGSDAVAGVVNLILDTKRSGLTAEAQYGVSTYGDGGEYRLGLTYGTEFAGGRGHFVVSGEYADNAGILAQSDRPWGRAGWQVIANPAYRPGNGEFARLTVRNAHIANATEGGLIVSPGPFQNIEFGPGGVPEPFVRGGHASSGFMAGGDGTNLGLNVTLQVPVERQTLFGRASYDVSDTLSVFAEASYGRTFSEFNILPTFDFGTIPIRSDNAYLSAGLRQDMLDQGVAELRIGRLNTDFGYARSSGENVTKRGVIGLEGELSPKWKWDASVQYGRTHLVGGLKNSRLQARFVEAVDAVIDPATGRPVCRSALMNPGNGCVPLNIFGKGSPQADALAYIHADQRAVTNISQTVAAFNVDGQPFSTWAGPVSTAFGIEYRREATDQSVDASTAAGGFTLQNPVPVNGSFDVREAYGELVIPLAANTAWARALDLDLAVRATDYSISGYVTTWKAGLSYAIDDSLRLRATRSRDIRAPNIGELFSQTQTLFRTVTDPLNGQQTTIRMLRGGNPDLSPERADTVTAGIVYEPRWLPGFRASVDVYDIKIKQAVGSLEAQDIINRCAGGATQLCSLIQRGAGNSIEAVKATLINLNTLKTRGIDFELSYRSSLAAISEKLPGDISLRLLGTYVDTLITDDGITAIDRAGDVGPSVDGIPHWRWNVSATYSGGPTTFQVLGRYVGGGAYDHSYDAFGIDDNRISSRFYVDASIQYDLAGKEGKGPQLFLAINNLFNIDPPVAPDSVFVPLATNKYIYDVVGRYASIGFRFKID